MTNRGGSPHWPQHEGPASVEAIERQPVEHWLRGKTVPEMIRTAADSFGDAIVYRFLATPLAKPVDLTFSQLHDLTGKAAHRFHRAGSSPVIASLLPSIPSALPLAFGAMQAGIYMPINPMLSAGAIAGMLAHAEASVLLAPDDADAGTLDAIRERTPSIDVVTIPADRHDLSAIDGWPHPSKALQDAPEPGDLAAYIHTGGTTGAPKIAQLTHANLAFMAFLSAFGGGMRIGDVIPCGMPLYHVGGVVFGSLAPMAAGARIVQLGANGFRDETMRKALPDIARRERATILVSPPTIAIDVLGSTEEQGFDGVKYWVSSTAPFPKASQERFTRHTGLTIKEAWGLTEATLVLTFAPPYGPGKPGTVGHRLPYCEIEVIDPASGQPLPNGDRGLIIARSPGLFAGYLGVRTDDGLRPGPDGRMWLDTGDLGVLDADGYLTVTGRAKDMILRGGHNIDPKSIETAYLALADVTEAIAVGKPDERVGERPLIFVVCRPGATVPAETLRDLANPAIADPVARPRHVIVLDQLPRTAVGKPDRIELRRQAAEIAVSEILPKGTGVEIRLETGGRLAAALDPHQEPDAARIEALGLNIVYKQDGSA